MLGSFYRGFQHFAKSGMGAKLRTRELCQAWDGSFVTRRALELSKGWEPIRSFNRSLVKCRMGAKLGARYIR